MGWACSTNGEKMNACRLLVGNQRERDHWEDQDTGKVRFFRQKMGWCGPS
jgi:hypothetical protein